MAENIKQIHPNYVVMYKVGVFYHTYGKDSYIIASNYGYSLKNSGNVISCGFPEKAINKVKTVLEDKKINYILLDPRNNYEVDEKSNNKNLNTYDKELKKAYLTVKQKNKINTIKERLELYIGKDEFKDIIRKVEDVLDESGEI